MWFGLNDRDRLSYQLYKQMEINIKAKSHTLSQRLKFFPVTLFVASLQQHIAQSGNKLFPRCNKKPYAGSVNYANDLRQEPVAAS